MPAAQTLQTDDLAARERLGQWREWIAQHFGGLESDFYGDCSFDGRLSSAPAGEVLLTRLQANRHRVLRSEHQRWPDAGDYLKIVAPLQGCAGVEQAGRQSWVRQGSWVIYDTTRAYRVDNPEPSDHLIVMLPRAQLAWAGQPLEPLLARAIGGHSGIARLALEAMHSTYQELSCMGESAARGAGELIAHLVRLSLQELAGRPAARAGREALRDRARRYIALHLHDPSLEASGIAQALGCSRRTLYSAFAPEDCSISRYIQQQRLQACSRALSDEGQRGRSITELALACGFASSAHFSRLFRAQWGLSPGDYRKQCQDPGLAGAPWLG
jgi:AraC-like DNA-binding protein